MATFKVKVYRLEIEEHPNADELELARIGDYRTVVQKGVYKTGDLGVYIPEAAVLPEWLIKEMGLEGRLAGKNQNRVKAIKLRGILSQGLVYPLIKEDFPNGEVYVLKSMEDGIGITYTYGIKEGDDVTEKLEIIKYEPPIPIHMQGEVFNAHGYTIKFDIKNFKAYPNVLKEGEEVIITEKLHGSWCCYGFHPEVDTHIITSNGLSDQGLALKINEVNKKNLYIRTLDTTAKNKDGSGGNILDFAHGYFKHDKNQYGLQMPFYILGEIYGSGVQKAFLYGEKIPQFRIFDVYIGEPGQGRYLNYEELFRFCSMAKHSMVPLLYEGPFSKEKMLELTEGKTVLADNHIREGVVIKPKVERLDNELGRVILKSLSEAYLLRKGGTEYK